ncbi:hypothetical protein [Lentzea sp. E54]|uniref:hypothetical protein n=1 Tax=Lentzea xerophila TaxID=3435883 RepID=UPI003DA211EF
MQLIGREVKHKRTGLEGTATGEEGSHWWVEWEDGDWGWVPAADLHIDAWPA